jgi:hypothetical protein
MRIGNIRMNQPFLHGRFAVCIRLEVLLREQTGFEDLAKIDGNVAIAVSKKSISSDRFRYICGLFLSGIAKKTH